MDWQSRKLGSEEKSIRNVPGMSRIQMPGKNLQIESWV